MEKHAVKIVTKLQYKWRQNFSTNGGKTSCDKTYYSSVTYCSENV